MSTSPRLVACRFGHAGLLRCAPLLYTLIVLLHPAHSRGDDRALEPIDFNRHIRPLLANRCFRCHGPDPGARQANLRLDVEAEAKRSHKTRPAIASGDPDTSELIRRVTTSDPSERMPPTDAGEVLSNQEIDLLRRWITAGAPWARHWSLVAPVPPRLPEVSESWSIDPLDRFVVARLATENLVPSPRANSETLIRRVTLDLTGLPPALEEVDVFLEDSRPDAYQRLVDRLLTSPTFGERWARVWLDLARYADSAGYAQDPPRAIWRYRDWVINALNAGMSFDQFTLEQIAGDMLPEATNSQLIATAFHRNTMTNSEGGTDDEEFRTAAVVDRVNTTMQVWMGITFGCAQCHTHKYDPVTTEEYYRFFAVFNNTVDTDKIDERPTLAEYTDAQLKERTATEAELLNLERSLESPPPIDDTGPLTTRHVRVELPGTGVPLHLAEVQAFSNGKNLAHGASASQSSVAYLGLPGLAVDGKTDGDFLNKRSTTHTANDDAPWWQVDLSKGVSLDRVVVWNRTDGNEAIERLRDFRVVLLDEKSNPIWVTTVADPPRPSVTIEIPARFEAFDDAKRAELALHRRRRALKSRINSITGIRTPIMRELGPEIKRSTHVLIRGNFLNLGKKVSPGVPQALHPLPVSSEPNRLSIAQWLVAAKNPLTARVLVNRHWEQLFGTGLVDTSEDFGIQGALPSHPALLDFLATEIVRNGWDTKRLLRRVVTSSTYSQSARVTRDLLERDRFNRLLARGPRVRLSAEMVRDHAMAVSGLLSRKIGGPSVRPPRPALGLRAAFGGSTDWEPSAGDDRFRRGLYTRWRRTTPYPSMTTFDAPSREFCTVRRIRTNTPLQALVTLNDPVFIEAAQGLARRVLRECANRPSVEARIEHAFRLCLVRRPRPDETKRISDLWKATLKRYRDDSEAATQISTNPRGPAPEGVDVAELAAWTIVSNVLLNLDEFIMKR